MYTREFAFDVLALGAQFPFFFLSFVPQCSHFNDIHFGVSQTNLHAAMGHTKKIDKKKVHGLVFRAEFIHLLRAIEQFGSVSIHSVVLEIQIRVNLNYIRVFIRYYDYHFLAMQNRNECKFAHRKKVTIDCSNPNDRTSFVYSQQLYVNETKWN